MDTACGGGDFLLSTNILLSGNNFAKVALLFKFMNIGDGEQEHLLLHSGHLLRQYNKGLLGREKDRGSLSA